MSTSNTNQLSTRLPNNLIQPGIITPVQSIQDERLTKRHIKLHVKREDLVDPLIQGNKWHKLRLNLEQARNTGQSTLLTFGGCYSNHIHATAAAGLRYGFKTIGIIRGPKPTHYSPTLRDAKAAGMRLQFIDRETYRHKHLPEVLQSIVEPWGPVYVIPEGGSNRYAVEGCCEFVQNINSEFGVVCCPCGTGGTLAGLIKGLQGKHHALGFAVLKNAGFLNKDIEMFLAEADSELFNNWSVNLDYHFGGYAKSNAKLERFIVEFYQQTQIPLEPVYSGKMFYGLYDLIDQGYIIPGTRILAVHTGGLQGLEGFPRLKNKLGR